MLINGKVNDIVGDWAWKGPGAVADWTDGRKFIEIHGDGLHITDSSFNLIDILPTLNRLDFGNTANDPAFNFLGSGLLSTGGNINVGTDLLLAPGSITAPVSGVINFGGDGIDNVGTMAIGGGAVPAGTLFSVSSEADSISKVIGLKSLITWGGDSDNSTSITAYENNFWPNAGSLGDVAEVNLMMSQLALFNATSMKITEATITKSAYFSGGSHLGDVDDLYFFRSQCFGTPIGGTVLNAYGLFLDDINMATNNWAIKTGLGKVELGDSLFLAETTEKANVAGFGQVWCKDNAGTTELWFSDDNGNDTQLA